MITTVITFYMARDSHPLDSSPSVVNFVSDPLYEYLLLWPSSVPQPCSPIETQTVDRACPLQSGS